MSLSRDQILARRADLPRESVDVPELGGSVMIRLLQLKEVREFQKAIKGTADAVSLYPRLIAMACVNDDGSPLFVGEDVNLVETLPFAATETLARAILRHSKMVEDRDGAEAPKA